MQQYTAVNNVTESQSQWSWTQKQLVRDDSSWPDNDIRYLFRKLRLRLSSVHCSYYKPIRHISTGSFTWSDNLHNLHILKPNHCNTCADVPRNKLNLATANNGNGRYVWTLYGSNSIHIFAVLRFWDFWCRNVAHYSYVTTAHTSHVIWVSWLPLNPDWCKIFLWLDALCDNNQAITDETSFFLLLTDFWVHFIYVGSPATVSGFHFSSRTSV